ncbi:MAG: hypothetical protein V4664_03300 [Patescibacteria group bacterium]
MKNPKQIFISLCTLAVILSGISLVDAAGVWTNPTATAPGNNTDAPINVGTSAQDKAGVLRVTGFRSFFDAIFDTKVQIATTATMPSNLKFLAAGDVGARRYCDEAGTNCVAATSSAWTNMGSGGGGGSTALDCSLSGPNAYDSGFQPIAQGETKEFSFGKDLGIDTIVYYEGYNMGGREFIGDSIMSSPSVNVFSHYWGGLWWFDKTSTSIKFYRSAPGVNGGGDQTNERVRVVVKKGGC